MVREGVIGRIRVPLLPEQVGVLGSEGVLGKEGVTGRRVTGRQGVTWRK